MKKQKKGLDLYSLLLTLIYVALGLVLILWPETSAMTICLALGAVLLSVGAFHIISYFARSQYSGVIRQSLILGIMLIVLGIFILLRTSEILQTLPYLFGVLLLFDSATKVQAAFDLKRLGVERWNVPLLIGGATAILGIVLIVNPFTAVTVLNTFIGVSLVINAVANLISSIIVSYRLREPAKPTSTGTEDSSQS